MIKRAIPFLFITVLILSACTLTNAQRKNDTPLKAKPIPVEKFKYIDIGNPAIAGSVKIMNNGFDITAGGTDIWGTKDEFNFIYIERDGNFDMVSRIESLTDPHLYTKAGIMAREDLTSDCRHIYFQVFPNNKPRNKNNGGFEFQYRTAKGGDMKAIYPENFEGTPEFPVAFPNTWIRLQRIENNFTGYYSSDGINWKAYTTFTLELPVKVYLGLAVTSHNADDFVSAKFRDIGELKH
ncbi:MAG TPA: hypothetical protein VMV77_06035 [Bacteroidales bacterium]|nr:hypothetical protein [Bacteroidales bacterium]